MMQVHIHMSKADTYETLGTLCLKQKNIFCILKKLENRIVQSSKQHYM